MKTLSIITAAILTTLTALVIWVIESTPDGTKIKSCLTTSLYSVKLCDESDNYVKLANISPIMRAMVLVSEDASFYSHNGFDWAELQKSFNQDIESGRIVRGGSTITQQLAKNVFLTKDRTLLRKLREALLTVEIEAALTKDKILEKYLNVIEFGPELYGIKAASQHYFNKPPSEINLLEAAYLTFLIPNPKVYSRTFDKKALTPFTRFRVLDLSYKMYQTKRISEDEYLAAKASVDQFPWYGGIQKAIPNEITPEPTATADSEETTLPTDMNTDENAAEKSADETPDMSQPGGNQAIKIPRPEAPMPIAPSSEEKQIELDSLDN